jgi:DegV family protein with EDD domain
MGKIAIVTDSTAYIPKNYVEQYGLYVVPTILNWGSEMFRDGINITPTEFFQRMKTDPVHPTTSVPSIGEFRDVYAKAAEGADAVVGIHLAGKLSGTFSTAEQAVAMIPDKVIKVLETNSTAMAQGFVVLAAARAAAAGQPLEGVLQAAYSTIPKTGVVLTVETLEYLRRGGRIGGAQAFLGQLLDAKPILEIRDGRIEPLERVRTKKKAMNRLVEIVVERLKGKSPIRLATLHAAAPDDAAFVLEAAKAQLGNVEEAILAEVSPTIATHTGPGTVGLAYCVG